MRRTLLTILLLFIISLQLNAAGKKSIYIRTFKTGQGLKAEDPVGERIKDYISEVISESGDYTIISDDEVKQIIEQEELQMAVDACSDEECIKTLMKSLRTDYIIYGTVSILGGKYHLTAKIIDRAGDTIKLARVKTLIFRDENKMRMASVDLARYLTDGREIDMGRYDDDYRSETEEEKKIPSGLTLYGIYFTPLKTPFKTYYDSLAGGGIDYIKPSGNYYALFGGISYIQGSDNIQGKAVVSINSYSLGLRAGFPTLNFVYPYIGAGGNIAWYNERTSGKSTSFMGYGINGFAGCAFVIWDPVSIWGDFSCCFMKLNDKEDADISGTMVRAGLSYKF